MPAAVTPEQRQKIAKLRLLWISHSFGYFGDLMYFGEIFRALREWIPRMAVVVDAEIRFKNPYGIALRPLMRLHRKAVWRQSPAGASYETEIAIPGPMLLPRLLREPVDVMIAIEFTLPALIATLIATLRCKPLVLLIESDPAARGASSHPVVRLVKRWAVRRATVIQTNNAQGRRYLLDELGVHSAIVRVAPYLTSRPPGPPPTIKAHLGPLRMLFANSLVPWKGLRELLAALAVLAPESRRQIELTVVGDGPERGALEHQASALEMGERLRFVGRRSYDRLGSFYAAADVLAIPSLADYRSLAGFEGLGYGLALVSSMYDGATVETVVDGENGFVIDPRNAVEFAGMIDHLVQDRDLLLRMRRAGLARYESHFSLESVRENLAQSVLLAVAPRGASQ